MVDTSEFLEGQYMTVDLVKQSPSKKCVIIGEPTGEETDFGFKLTAKVQIDGKDKIWRMNKDSIKNLRQLGVDSNTWDGAIVNLRVVTISGKECIIGVPEMKSPQDQIVEKPK